MNEQKYITSLGIKIREERIKRGLSVKELADGASVSRTQMYRIEAGTTNSSVSVLKGIADTFGITVSDLTNL